MSNRTPAMFAGFVEGLFAPVIELVVGVLISATLFISDAMSSASGTPSMSNNIALAFTLIATVDIIRNLIISYTHSQFALGNIIGNICGLFLFYGAINAVSPESANSSLLWTIVMLASLILGIFVTIWKAYHEQSVGSY